MSYVLPLMYFYFFRREISELTRPIAVKLCHTITISVRFITQVQKFGEPSPKISTSVKFEPILHNFRL